MRDPVTILLVEDDQSMLNGMSDLLQVADLGYEVQVLTASNGKAALEIMSRWQPDLIVSDIMMPSMDGYELLQVVRQNPAWLHIPFIFLTAKGEKKEVLQGRLSGVDLYIVKPFNSNELLELVASQLKKTFQLQEARQQTIDSLKKSILQILNHEFRTPLTYVTAYYEMLADSLFRLEDVGNFQDYLNGIQAGCTRLTRLVEEFIQVMELRTGETKATYEESARPIINLNDLVQEVVIRSQKQAQQQNSYIHYAPGDWLPPVFGDPASLFRVFDHLLDNALKFTCNHKKSDGNVYVSTYSQNGEVFVSVQDEGIGFPRLVQGQIFELFFQYNRNLLEQQGAGAGLTICKGLIDLHGGRIEVNSQEDVGSRFTVVLPVYNGETSASPAAHVAKAGGRKEVSVLVVEDDQHLLAGLQELLEIYDGKYQLNTLAATNGLMGLDVLAGHQVDLIISDIMMPKMGGYEFLQQVQQNPDWFPIPFIFLTAKGERRDVHRGLSSGVEEYITKPYDSDELLGLVVIQLDRYFERQNLLAQSFDALKRSIVRLITPDFRLPLSTVAAFSEKLTAELASAQTETGLRDSLRSIQTASVRLTRLVEDLISLAELRTEEATTAYALRAQPLRDVGILLCEAGQAISDRTEHLDVEVHCQLSADLPLIYGDSVTLIESVRRLIIVGCKYDYPSTQDVFLSAASAADEIHLSIRFCTTLSTEDEGKIRMVLGEEMQDSLDLAPDEPGLSIARGYVGLHNGSIQLNVHDDRSFTFTIILPVYRETQAEGEV